MEIFTLEQVVNTSIVVYALLLFFLFVALVSAAYLEINYYIRKNNYVSYKPLLVSPHAPSISVIAPVSNVERNVIDQVRALLALQYNNFDVVVINDGSTDTTLLRLKEFFQLEKIHFAVNEQLKAQRIHSYYKSKNPAYSKLMVIDKVYGGTADSLNAGINASEKSLVLCIELDCVFDKNSLLKLVKPFMENQKRVIAASTAVSIANSSQIKHGNLLRIKFPRAVLPAFQAINFFKSYLVERLAMTRLNGVHVSSGAINLFDKEILIASRGYNTKILKKGFELLVRMCRYMHDNELDYRVINIPESLCWVHIAEDWRGVSRQQKASALGNFQTLKLNRDLFFNPNYGFLGLISIPFWFLLELVTPFFKVISLLMIGVMGVFHILNWEHVIILVVMIYSFAVMLSLIALLFEEKTYKPYASGQDLLRILIVAFVEPLVFNPISTYWKISAYLGNKKTVSYLKNEVS